MTVTPSGSPRHFLDLNDFSIKTLRGILGLAADLKARLKSGDRPGLHAVVHAARSYRDGTTEATDRLKDVRVIIDVDPQSML